MWRASVLPCQLSVFLCVCVSRFCLLWLTPLCLATEHSPCSHSSGLSGLETQQLYCVCVCVCCCVGLYMCGHVHSLATCTFAAMWLRGLTGTVCQPSFSVSSYSGPQPAVYSASVLCWKAAEWNEFTFPQMLLKNIHALRKTSQLLVLFSTYLIYLFQVHCCSDASLAERYCSALVGINWLNSTLVLASKTASVTYLIILAAHTTDLHVNY